MHGGVKFDLVVSLTLKFIFDSEDLDDLFGQIAVNIFFQVVLIGEFTDFKVEFYILNVFELLLVLSHCATD